MSLLPGGIREDAARLIEAAYQELANKYKDKGVKPMTIANILETYASKLRWFAITRDENNG